MYIAICDDQEYELNILKDLIEKWQTYHHPSPANGFAVLQKCWMPPKQNPLPFICWM